MNNGKLEEKRERFRLYGEICLLMEENGRGFVDDFDIDAEELERFLGEPILVFTDDDDDHAKKLEDIEFTDCMLWVGCSNEQAMFMDVCSWTLHQIYEALKNFLRRKDMSTSDCPYFSETAPVCDDGECGCFECLERIEELRKKGE